MSDQFATIWEFESKSDASAKFIAKLAQMTKELLNIFPHIEQYDKDGKRVSFYLHPDAEMVRIYYLTKELYDESSVSGNPPSNQDYIHVQLTNDETGLFMIYLFAEDNIRTSSGHGLEFNLDDEEDSLLCVQVLVGFLQNRIFPKQLLS